MDKLDMDEILNILQNSLLFKNFSKEKLIEFIEDNFIKTFWKKGETIQSDINIKYFHIILKGRLKITNIDPKSGRSISLFLLKSGDVFDIFTLLDGKEHDVLPIALDDVYILQTSLHNARNLLKNYPEFNKAFLPYLGHIMRELESFGESVVFNNTHTRLAKLILKYTLPKDKSDNSYHFVDLINNLSHEYLAEMIGSVRSVVSTQMEKLKKEGIVKSGRGHIVVKDLEKLIKKCDLFQNKA